MLGVLLLLILVDNGGVDEDDVVIEDIVLGVVEMELGRDDSVIDTKEEADIAGWIVDGMRVGELGNLVD